MPSSLEDTQQAEARCIQLDKVLSDLSCWTLASEARVQARGGHTMQPHKGPPTPPQCGSYPPFDEPPRCSPSTALIKSQTTALYDWRWSVQYILQILS